MSAVLPEEMTDGAVSLRPWREEDAQALVACLDGDPEVSAWLDRIPQPYTVADALAYIRGETGAPRESRFAVATAAGDVVGSIGAMWNESGDVAEIGYWTRADARGRGTTTQALRLVTAWALEHGAERVQLRADVENVASRRVAEKVGFQTEGVLRAAYWNPRLDRRQNWVMYSLLPGELASGTA